MKNSILDFIVKYNPYILIALPCILGDLIGLFTGFSGGILVGNYLLNLPSSMLGYLDYMEFVFLANEIFYIFGSILFLWPAIQAHRKKDNSEKTLSIAKSRIYNFPSLLIILVWTFNTINFSIFIYFLLDILPIGPMIFTSLVSTMVSAIVVYYSSEFLNRFLLIPFWFPDGNIKVSKKLKVPSLFARFGDSFLISGILPVISIGGVIFMTYRYGSHGQDELEKLLYVTLIIGSIFWIFGGLLTYLNGKTFFDPLLSMEAAVKEFSKGNFHARVVVHSDDQIGILENAVNKMGEELYEKEKIKTVFGHYVSPAVRDLILNGKVRVEGDKIEAVILFSDIRSFTSISENFPPERVVKLLNIHFSRIVDIVGRNDGFVDKFIGDAVMAVFDEELTSGNHKISALKAAAEILSELENTNEEIKQLGFPPIKIGIGIASGPVIRGNIGSDSRRELTVIGDIVNLASRLESATKDSGTPILITKDSFDKFCEEYSQIRTVLEKSLLIRGKSNRVNVLGLDLSDRN